MGLGAGFCIFLWLLDIETRVGEFVVGLFGFYFTALVVFIFAWVTRGYWKEEICNLRAFWRKKTGKIIVSAWLVTTVLFWTGAPWAFKTMADEAILAVTSMLLHYDTLAWAPTVATYEQGEFELIRGTLEKRPLLFPFLVSAVHDFTGYRPENAIYFNLVLSSLILALWARIGWYFSAQWGAIMALGLCLGLPVLLQNGTGAGFDLLNALLVVFATWLAVRYWENPDSKTLAPFVISFVLLGWTRYEGLYWSLGFTPMILLGWLKARRVILNRVTASVPWLLVLPFFHQLLRNDRGEVWQPGAFNRSEPFSLSYFWENVEGVFIYLFNLPAGDVADSASLLLAALGFAGVAVGIVAYARVSECLTGWFWAMLIAYLGHLSVLLTFNYGYFPETIVTRLSLPLQMGFIWVFLAAHARQPKITALAAIGVLALVAFGRIQVAEARFLLEEEFRWFLLVLFFVFFLVFVRRWLDLGWTKCLVFAILAYAFLSGLPRSRLALYEAEYFSQQAAKQVISFLQENASSGSVYLTRRPYLPIAYRFAAMSPFMFLEKHGDLGSLLASGEYEDVWIELYEQFDERTHEWVSLDDFELHPGMITEDVELIYGGPLVRVRIVRLLDIYVP